MSSASEINNATNERTMKRRYPSAPLRPYYQTRSVPTRQTKLMTTDPAVSNNVPLNEYDLFSPEKIFNPSDTNAPFELFQRNVDVESNLRNQLYALQSCPQADYVPSSKSDLFSLQSFALPEHTDKQPHTFINQVQDFAMKNPNVGNICRSMFNNCSRQELKNINTKPK